MAIDCGCGCGVKGRDAVCVRQPVDLVEFLALSERDGGGPSLDLLLGADLWRCRDGCGNYGATLWGSL